MHTGLLLASQPLTCIALAAMGVNVQRGRSRDRSVIRSRGGPSAFPLAALSFSFLKGSLVSAQGSSLTFTRSTTALEFGSNGLLQSYAINTPRFGYNQATLASKGLLIEPSATQLVTPLASVRDMTNAAWVKVTMTAAKTAIGADGSANAASTITATAGSATILQTLVAAASSRTFSALVKRRTGTGTVLIIQGATTLDITALINSTTYTLVQLNANVLNAAFGFQINTNGDAIDVDYNQFEAGDITGLANSRIPDTGTTRGADLCVITLGAWYNATSGTLYCEWLNPNNSGTFVAASINDGSANNRMNAYTITTPTSGAAVLVGGVTQSNLTGSIAGNIVAKVTNSYQLNNFSSYGNGVSFGVDASGTIPTVTTLEIGSDAGGTLYQLGSYIRNFAYYPQALSAVIQQRLTT